MRRSKRLLTATRRPHASAQAIRKATALVRRQAFVLCIGGGGIDAS
jgi:hypothetical protein